MFLDGIVERELMLFAIRIHSAILPATVALAATLLFWLLYDLTPKTVNANKKKLEEMRLKPKPIGALSSGEWSAPNISHQNPWLAR